MLSPSPANGVCLGQCPHEGLSHEDLLFGRELPSNLGVQSSFRRKISPGGHRRHLFYPLAMPLAPRLLASFLSGLPGAGLRMLVCRGRVYG